MSQNQTSESPETPAKEKDLAGIASTDLLAVGEIVENIGQAWCLCPSEWGIEDYITIQSSQGRLALCAVGRVVGGPNRGKLRHEPLTKGAIHDLSPNARHQRHLPAEATPENHNQRDSG